MRTYSLCGVLFLLCACEFPFANLADQQFGHQHFASAVAAIELHNTRNGRYPDSLRELEYLGDWDGIWIGSIDYERTDSGYNLFVERGWIGEPSLELPIGFKSGLGLEESNVTWIADAGKNAP